MSGTHTVVVGNKGRMVVPAEVRERRGWTEGTHLVLMDSPGGAVLMTRDELLRRVRDDLEGLDLVGELLADRRRSALEEEGE